MGSETYANDKEQKICLLERGSMDSTVFTQEEVLAQLLLNQNRGYRDLCLFYMYAVPLPHLNLGQKCT
jgi:hypothetical protein